MTRKVSVAETLVATFADTLDLEEAIRFLLADVDTLIAITVLSRIITDKAHSLHGVQMRIEIVDPTEAATTPAG